MSEHDWSQEQIAIAATEGLNESETARLDAHLRECPECAAQLTEMQNLNDRLGSLFTSIKSGPALEDRVFQAVHAEEVKQRQTKRWRRRLAAGIAATIGLGLTGAVADGILNDGALATLASYPVPKTVDSSGSMATPQDHGRSSSAAQQRSGIAREKSGAAESDGSQSRFTASVRERGSAAVSEGSKAAAIAGADQLKPYLEHDLLDPQGNVRPEAFDLKSGLPDWAYGNSAATPPNLASTRPPQGGIASIPDGNSNSAFYADQFAAATSTSGSFWADPHAALPSGASAGSLPEATPPWPPKNRLVRSFETPAADLDAAAANLSVRRQTLTPEYVKPTDLKPQAASPGKSGASAATPLAAPAPQAPDSKAEGKSLNLAYQPPKDGEPSTKKPAPSRTEPTRQRKLVIRSGEMTFEVESFDSSVATVTRLVASIDGAFVATVNSEKLPNAKVKGTIVLRVPPERLDSLVLDLRKELGKTGELKGQRVGSEDITKHYTDLESRLRAARTMEERLLLIIKEGKGEIKQLLEVEKELGVWRTKIEEYEGELRYYSNLVGLSTLTLTLVEREIQSLSAVTESERVQAGVEVEDVDKALQDAQKAIVEAKGRITKSELKQLAAGQFNATLNCEVPRSAAGPFRDRLHQLGRVTRLEIDRVQQSEGDPAALKAKVTQGDTQFLLQFYNTANVAPRETTTLQLAVPDVPAAYQALRDAVTKAHGRVITGRLDEHDRQNVLALFDFEVRRSDEPALQAALAEAGEIVARNVTRVPEGDNLTDAKVLFHATLFSAGRIKPRETTILFLEVPDVDVATKLFGAEVSAVKGRSMEEATTRERDGRVTARVTYDVPLATAVGIVEKFKGQGIIVQQQSNQDLQAPNGRFATARLSITLTNADPIVGSDSGLWPQIRRGLTLSTTVLLMSVTWIIFGLCVVLPWAVVGYGGYRVFRRFVPEAAADKPATPATPTTPPTA
jgi:hypothetical protein